MFNRSLWPGNPIALQAARADGGPRILRAFDDLSHDTIYTRCSSYIAEVSSAVMAPRACCSTVSCCGDLASAQRQTLRPFTHAQPGCAALVAELVRPVLAL